MQDLLPSLRFRGDDPRPVGFTVEVSPSHVEAAGRALTELAQAVGATGAGDRELRVCFSSAQYVPGLPFNLFAFHIVDFDDKGRPLDEVASGAEVLYAVVMNQPIEVQRELALLFLYDLLFRQIALSDPGADPNQADVIAARATERARAEFRDRMRSGWREAAKSLVTLAQEAGLGLQARYRVDPFPERDALVRRVPALRETYNSIELAREFIDKVVSLIAGRDPRVSLPGAPDEIRVFVQRKLTELGLRQYTTQTLRDAEVLGNGYLVMPTTAGDTPYNLRPEEVEVLGEDRFAVVRDGERQILDAPVVHDRGVEQFESPYGFSVLEAILPEWIGRQRLEAVEQQTEELVARLGRQRGHQQYLAEVRDLVRRHREESDARLGKLLWYPRDWVPEAVEGLYFPGQERM